jgi:hypothetical protein
MKPSEIDQSDPATIELINSLTMEMQEMALKDEVWMTVEMMKSAVKPSTITAIRSELMGKGLSLETYIALGAFLLVDGLAQFTLLKMDKAEYEKALESFKPKPNKGN